jgi:dipeptide/tripeptide permease
VCEGVELCERLTTLGIAVNLVTYLTGTMHLGNAVSANTVTNFLGTSFMLCLLGGFVADTYLGRCVFFGCSLQMQYYVYAVGSSLTTFVVDSQEKNCHIIFLSLCFGMYIFHFHTHTSKIINISKFIIYTMLN